MRTFLIVGAAMAAAMLSAAPAAAQRDPMARFMAADANGDGEITRAEARAARETLFTRLDVNNDGYLTEADRQGRPQREGRAGRMGQGVDANGDGRVSREEFTSQMRGFDRADSNRDGTLQAGEIETVRQLMAARRGARQTQTE